MRMAMVANLATCSLTELVTAVLRAGFHKPRIPQQLQVAPYGTLFYP
jgi:hypothetical protein